MRLSKGWKVLPPTTQTDSKDGNEGAPHHQRHPLKLRRKIGEEVEAARKLVERGDVTQT